MKKPNKYRNFKIKEYLKVRPLSWSMLSSFEYDKEQWFQQYFLNIKTPPTNEMLFGRFFAKQVEARQPLAPVTIYSEVEYKFKVVFNGIHMVGYADTFCGKTKKKLVDHKTGIKKWDQKRADEHGQITMYALFNYLTHKVNPQHCEFAIEYIPTQQNNDFSVSLIQPVKVYPFKTKRTMKEMLAFGVRIMKRTKEMEEYVRNHA